ncbi:oligopeptide transporter 2-like [Selaginella moellendorffii]|uniref:oligopeptide transporter 2-like n=1 Tax=Selaginella moellendorffii TaxID=88036 RepID=UPI000D1C2F6E|nr:oligopeptide transporter 2-like [Selaginella moellendorffii]XP_024538121.1 oligopeptide transporter 2-like [Selaginella moellendorffii]|eukprot:XP_024532543.1 oligopeptide transporter 2-like [Selaginella moellendorffii]
MAGAGVELVALGDLPMDERDTGDDEQSPIDQVAMTVSTSDDPAVPVWTFRMWTIGLFFCIVLSFVNQFFYYRKEPLTVSALSGQILAVAIGRLMAATLPKTVYRLPLTNFHFTLNPGPFNKKEHVLITVFANSGFAFGNGTSYGVSIVDIIKAFYKRKIYFHAALLLVITTQVLGYGWAGLLRKHLVEPANMWWPANLVQVSLFETLHEKESKKGLSRLKFFLIVLAVSFAYYIIPGYMFTALTSVSWVCWAFPRSVLAQQLGSGLNGLGLGSFALDWSTFQSFLQSPLITPWVPIANVLAGFIIMVYIVIPAFYWTNVYDAKKFPIFSSKLFQGNGTPYNVHKIVNENFEIDMAAYKEQGEVHLSTFFAMAYGLGFASVASVITHIICFHGKEIWQRSRSVLNEKPDIHTRLMKKYPTIPYKWFVVLMFLSIAVAVGTCVGFKHQLQLPWWGVLLACALAIVFTLPIGIITATTNITPGLNVITEYIIGYMLPGKPIANVCFKTYGYISMTQAISFLQDFKLGHYMKVPPRSMFAVQVLGTIVAAVVNVATAWWMLTSVENICDTDKLPADSPWTCPNDSVFYSASVIWGLIGPKRIFGSLGNYSELSWFFLVGALAPVVLWLLTKAFPRARWLSYINLPVILGATSMMPPASAVNYISWTSVGLFFNYFVYTYRRRWWQRYNYVLSAALDAGVAFMGVLLYFALQMNGTSVTWWGNDSHCPLARCPTYPGIVVPGCPVI